MLTTQMYKEVIKPDTYSDDLKLRIERTLEMEDVVYPRDKSFEIFKKILFVAWLMIIFLFIYGGFMQFRADYFILVVGLGVLVLFALMYVQSTLSTKYKIDRMLIRYFDNLKDNEIYKYTGTLEDIYIPAISKETGVNKTSYFAKIDGHMWQINKEDYDKIEKIKTQKVDLYFVKYNNLGENATALMVTPKQD